MKRHEKILWITGILGLALLATGWLHLFTWGVNQTMGATGFILLAATSIMGISDPGSHNKPDIDIQFLKIEIDGYTLWACSYLDNSVWELPSFWYTRFYFEKPQVKETKSWLYGTSYFIINGEFAYREINMETCDHDTLRKICRNVIEQHTMKQLKTVQL